MSATLSPSVLALTIGCTSAMDVWRVLENRFSLISRSHVMNLKGELHNIRKWSDSIDVYQLENQSSSRQANGSSCTLGWWRKFSHFNQGFIQGIQCF